MTLANAHALFCGLKNDPSYLANLEIDERERRDLMKARAEIRATLRDAAKQIVGQDEYWQESYAQRVSRRKRPEVSVKFMTQGSFAYRTINSPAQVPEQEIDLDDGMYVPVEFLENGEPALAAKGLFAFVERSLAPLCRKNGWAFATPKKNNCVRIQLWEGAHIDIPIYSIPSDRFALIVESLAKSADARVLAHSELPANAKLPSDRIMLAQRNGLWIQSDPQQLHDWVESRCERYGQVFRRLSRFFKGWRDFIWEDSPLSSLCVMCGVDLALRQLDGFPTENRDDEMIMEVAKQLPAIFKGQVANPVLKSLCLNEWSDDERREIVSAAEALRDEMVTALEHTGDPERVVEKLRARFGERVPFRPDAVKIGSKIAAIEKAAPAKVAAPLVIASTSG